jgi:hypothetical protein
MPTQPCCSNSQRRAGGETSGDTAALAVSRFDPDLPDARIRFGDPAPYRVFATGMPLGVGPSARKREGPTVVRGAPLESVSEDERGGGRRIVARVTIQTQAIP